MTAIEFQALYQWSDLGDADTIVLGASKPSDFDESLGVLQRFRLDDAATKQMVVDAAQRIRAALDAACGPGGFYPHTLSTHPINMPYQHTLSTHPITVYRINTLHQHTLSTHPINTLHQHTLSTHPIHTSLVTNVTHHIILTLQPTLTTS